MKKTIAVAVFLFAVAVIGIFGQTVGLLDTKRYAEYFGFKNGKIDPDDNYIYGAPRAERIGEISNLEGKERVIDTPLELALFSYYAASRIDVRPPEADAILPANNPKLADTKLGGAACLLPESRSVDDKVFF
jgi:hypothetical protein